ncbi:MAG: hypothetical protein ACR65O_05235 [Methylomicrobium sp.]
MDKTFLSDENNTKMTPEEFLEFELEFKNAIDNSIMAEIEQDLGLPCGFVKSIYDEQSDWGFIIKLSVIIEAALGAIISTHFGTTAAQNHIDRLSINGRIGKIKLATDLGLIGPKSKARLLEIFTIRNKFAHSLKVIQLSLDNHIKSLSDNERTKFQLNLLTIDDHAYRQDPPYDGENSRLLLWVGGCLCLVEFARIMKAQNDNHQFKQAHILLGEGFLLRMRGNEKECREKLRQAVQLLEYTKKKVSDTG